MYHFNETPVRLFYFMVMKTQNKKDPIFYMNLFQLNHIDISDKLIHHTERQIIRLNFDDKFY